MKLARAEETPAGMARGLGTARLTADRWIGRPWVVRCLQRGEVAWFGCGLVRWFGHWVLTVVRLVVAVIEAVFGSCDGGDDVRVIVEARDGIASCEIELGTTLSFTVKLGSVIEVAVMSRDGCAEMN
ncbi:hypothetical protein M0R45_028475 [Rubus argutus]|uniref:Uncharacterized protein n=1 Tax=Rubus argutus TaxID=59490 RepID=A0AAW1W7R7_RUBAR